ncbi:aromatic ring-hydroxylating oxygenase subunit alpha [Paenibacillus polymyxa]|uniref:aromatic ring-hydroxylating oxygenase subunit alpha n=1 Tax=Paenibacillus TaxID=44249 RepID=UPI002025ADC0|nr:aromatic ring-hydroxylating dioxygenase subunit alpha [Paenibacillus polymyxa]URJ41013.1 aromatic ring-hydroxylating dioxygenase subunit alpha [Paenibacillus polymyxa]
MNTHPSFREVRESDQQVFPIAWYAVGWSKELKNKPLKKRLLGKDIVLYRDDHRQVHAIHAYCPHRGADLSLGYCQNGHITCPYHAWSFDESGQCVDIPAHPGRAIPEFAHTYAYPAIEKAGLLWVYPQAVGSKSEINSGLGTSTSPPPLEIFSELEDPSLILSPYDSVWKAHLTRVVESVLDVAHLPIVHNKTIGKKSSTDIHIEFEADDNHIRVKNGKGLLQYAFPQQWILTPAKEGRSKFINFVTFTPIEQELTAIYGLAGRNFARFVPGISHIFSRYSGKVLEEDRAVVESQHPRPIPEALRMEAHVPADGPQVRFRNRWYDFLVNDEPRVRLNPGTTSP